MAVKVTVNKDACIGCGLCVGSYPETFEFDEEGKATVIADIDEAVVDEAISNCQLALLKNKLH